MKTITYHFRKLSMLLFAAVFSVAILSTSCSTQQDSGESEDEVMEEHADEMDEQHMDDVDDMDSTDTGEHPSGEHPSGN